MSKRPKANKRTSAQNGPRSVSPQVHEDYAILRKAFSSGADITGAIPSTTGPAVEAQKLVDELERNPAEGFVKLLYLFTERDLLQQRNQELEKLINQDSLTGLFNKRYLREQLDALTKAPPENERRHETGNQFMLIDLQHFKWTNDTYGHDAGDAALQRVADVLVYATHETDVVVRLGGDEFGVLLRGASREGADKKRSEIVEVLSKLDFTWFVENEEIRIPVRGNVGVCEIKTGMTTEDVLKQADAHMYENKRANAAKRGEGPVL